MVYATLIMCALEDVDGSTVCDQTKLINFAMVVRFGAPKFANNPVAVDVAVLVFYFQV